MSKSEAAVQRHRDSLFGDVERNWAWMLALGLFYLLLGGIGLAMLFGLAVVSILFIGVLMVAGGAAQLADAVTCRGWKGLVWHAAIAVLYIAGGVVVIYDPMSVSALISLAVGGVLAAVGLARILIARQMRARGTGALGMLLTGCAGVVLGAMIMLEWPLSGLFAIALFIAVDLLLQGVSMVWLALRARSRAVA